MSLLLDPDKDPLFAAYIQQNPMSIFSLTARLASRPQQNNSLDNSLAGSNNAPPGFNMRSGLALGANNSGANNFNGVFNNGGTVASNPIPPAPNINSGGRGLISFAEGGMMTPQGGAIRPNDGMMQEDTQLGASEQQLAPQQIEQEAQRFVQQHPEEARKIQEVIALAMQTGELTPEELNMAVQLAKTALASPQSYPQIRQFAIKNGLGTEQDLPQQMDQGLLYTLIVAGKVMQPSGNVMAGQAPSAMQQPSKSGVVPEYSDGGMTGNKAHIAQLHPREYVIPEDALIYHGKKHFDKLVEQARTPPDDGTK